MRVNFDGVRRFRLIPVYWEATMTTIEFFYLAICVAAFFAFALSLEYNSSSWKSWKRSQTAAKVVTQAGESVASEKKLAA